MRAGRLRHIVTVQKMVRVPDGMGQFTETWSDVGTIRAELRGLTGSELVKAGRLDANKTYRLWVRDNPTLDEGKRLIWGHRILNILHVAPDNKRRQMEILAEDTGQTA